MLTLSFVSVLELHQEERERIKSSLKKAEQVAVTTDMWTSKSNSSFTAVTAHFWSKEKASLVSKQLDCVRFFGEHKSASIQQELKKIFSDFDIRNKIISATADHASNEKKAIKDLGVNYVGCFAHDINLVVQDSIKATPGLAELTEKVSEVVTLTRKSPKAKDSFEACQKRAGFTKILRLIQSVRHRWNSLFEMLQRFLELKPSQRYVFRLIVYFFFFNFKYSYHIDKFFYFLASQVWKPSRRNITNISNSSKTS